MAQKIQPLSVDENPMLAIGQTLSYGLLAAVAMQEAIKLMEVPMQSWKIRGLAMQHAIGVEEDLKRILRAHQEVCAALKEIGY